MKALSLGVRLLLAYLLLGLLPLMALTWYSLRVHESAVESEALRAISAVSEKKQRLAERFFHERLVAAHLLAADVRWGEHLTQEAGLLELTPPQQARMQAAAESGPYRNIMLVDTQARVRYSLHAADPLGASLRSPRWRDAALARAVEQVLLTQDARFAAFEAYTNRTAGTWYTFIVVPVQHDGVLAGVLVLQQSVANWLDVLVDREGLGESGRVLLVTQDYNGLLVWEAQADRPGGLAGTLLPLDVASEPLAYAMARQNGFGVLRDEAGQPVAASWQYLEPIHAGLVVQQHEAEVFATLRQTQRVNLLVAMLTGLLVMTAAWVLGRRLVGQASEVERQRARYRAMFATMTDGVLLLHGNSTGGLWKVLDANPSLQAVLGGGLEHLHGQSLEQVLAGYDPLQALQSACEQVRARGGSMSVAVYRGGDPEQQHWLEVTVLPLDTDDIMLVCRDDTERRRAQEQREHLLNQLNEAQRLAQLGSWELNLTNARLDWSDEVFRIFEIDPRQFAASYAAFLQLVHPEDRDAVHDAYTSSLQTRAPYCIEHRLQFPDGRIKWVRECGESNFDAQGQPLLSRGTVQDITERKRSDAQIEYLARNDALTGLCNRHHFDQRLAQALALARRDGSQVVLAFVDLDRFKTINDTLGHQAGDELLMHLAQRLCAGARDSDIVARLGGDEFVLALVGLPLEQAPAVLDKLMQSLQKPYSIGGQCMTVTPSLGVSVFPRDGADPSTLLKHADMAMYRAKQLGRNRCEFFTSELDVQAQQRAAVERDLRLAIDRGELSLVYQAQVHAQAAGDAPPRAYEALMRWQHPERGLLSPALFIPVAEESDLIEHLGEWAIDEACRCLAAWRRQGMVVRRVAVNLSARQLRGEGLLGAVRLAMQRHGLGRGDLELEVTESAAMQDPLQAQRVLESLRDLGVELAIDDFGTGYSSLAYLKRLPIHTLKIDREFVRDIETDVSDAKISAATIALAHALGLKVVAEGVETPAQAEFLRLQGCDYLQGYLLGRPQTFEHVVAQHATYAMSALEAGAAP